MTTKVELPNMPSMRLDGRRALVTGAGRGIGLGCAAALAEAGAHVTLISRTDDEVSAAAAAIAERGQSADWFVVDVTQADAVAALLADQPAYDILVNNAGTNRPAPFLDVTEEDFDAVVALNVRATFFMSQMIARTMVAADLRGSIINMSSQMGHVGGALRTVYCASKHAIEGLTKAMAVDLSAHGIRVNSIGPTFIETVLTKQSLNQTEYRSAALEKIKLGRFGMIEDIMGAVVFLASDASTMMTGSSMIIDGGWTAD